MKKTAMIFALVLALGLFFLIPAQAEFVRHERRFEIPPMTFLNECTGEEVEIGGLIHILIKKNSTPSGQNQFVIHANGQGVYGRVLDDPMGYTGTIYYGNGILNVTGSKLPGYQDLIIYLGSGGKGYKAFIVRIPLYFEEDGTMDHIDIDEIEFDCR